MFCFELTGELLRYQCRHHSLCVGCLSTISMHLQNRVTILCGASVGRKNECLFAPVSQVSVSHNTRMYCKISLTLPVDLCLYMGFLIALRIVYSRALHGEL